jgi:hypothetical protein
MGLYLISVYFMGMYLISVYFMGMYLTGHASHWACTSWAPSHRCKRALLTGDSSIPLRRFGTTHLTSQLSSIAKLSLLI